MLFLDRNFETSFLLSFAVSYSNPIFTASVGINVFFHVFVKIRAKPTALKVAYVFWGDGEAIFSKI